MLQYEQDGAMQTLDWDRYYIQQEWNGAENTLHLTIPVRHPQMLSLAERMQLRESGDGLIYRVSKYDRGTSNLLRPNWTWTSCAGRCCWAGTTAPTTAAPPG